MYASHTNPHRALQPQAIVDSWDGSFELGPYPLLTQRCTSGNTASPPQKSSWASSVSAFDDTAPTPNVQSSYNFSDHMADDNVYNFSDPQVFPQNNSTFSLHGNAYPRADYMAGHQAVTQQPTEALMVPGCNDATISLRMPVDGTGQKPGAYTFGLHTIGYVCEEESSDYVFKCGNLACFNKSFGRWTELKRHYEGAHAVARRAIFWCEVHGCDRSEAFGSRPFPRKDKLRDHVRKVHAGMNRTGAKF